MAIATAGNKNGPVSDPNIVPLIDVLLVLIIIFMVITPAIPAGLPTLVPQPPQSQTKSPAPDTIVVQVMQGGELLINQEPSNWNDLGPRLSDIFKDRAEKVAFVKGAEEVPFAQVARAIDILRASGVTHVGLLPAAVH